MKIIGITGGVGAGKSQILKILEEDYHGTVIQADEVAKELEEPGNPGYQALVDAFGTEILQEDGRIHKKHFAQMIFQDKSSLAIVNNLIHPMTWERIRQKIGESKSKLIVIEAALFDATTKSDCDELWFIDTTIEVRVQRLMAQRGYTKEKCLQIMDNQPSREQFLAISDVVIDNNQTIDQVRHQIKQRMIP